MTDAVQSTGDVIADQIEAGRRAAAALTASPGTALTNAAPTAVGEVATPGPRLTMDTMMVQGLSVDAFIKPNEFGTMTIGDDKKQQEGFNVEIDTAAIMLSYAIKYGNPANYVKSYDGKVASTGGSWADAKARAQLAVGNAQIIREYNCADIPMLLLQPLQKQAAGETFPVGTKLGYSTPTTGWAAFESFINDVKAKGLMGKKVTVALTCTPRVNKANNKWGIVAFKLVGEAVELEEAA
jgi:hypothetical protein